MFDLKALVKNRYEILKAELFMLLHDVGKLQSGHQAKFIRGYHPPRWATGYKHDSDILEHPLMKSTNFLNTSFQLFGENVSLGTVITKHHGAKVSDGSWVVLTKRIDRLDSAWDRDSIIDVGVQPYREFIEIDTALGWRYLAYSRVVSDCQSIKCDAPLLSLCYKRPSSFQNDCLNYFFNCLIQIIQASHKRYSRSSKRAIIKFLMQKAAGDTRFSINDITLWDHAISTATLYKTLASWSVLFESDLNDSNVFPKGDNNRFKNWFRPQLLPIRIDGLTYLAQSNNIPDLLARRDLLQKVYDDWQDILEWEFPLAGEVYRDENGPVFLTFLRDQNAQDAITLNSLELPNDNEASKSVHPEARQKANELQDYLQQVIVHLTQGDLTLSHNLPLYTYTQKRGANIQQEKSLGDLLRDEQKHGLWFQADVEQVSSSWQDLRPICSVCGLRPQGIGAQTEDAKKAISRGMCGACLRRRTERARPWVEGIHQNSQDRFLKGYPETVWLDEVADENGRIALIVGYFPLENWLDGTLIESLGMFKRDSAEDPPRNRGITIKDENGTPIEVVIGPKPVSYSRIRRVWETTRRFWQQVAPTDRPPQWPPKDEDGNGLKDIYDQPLSIADSLAGKIVGQAGPRLEIRGISTDIQQGLNPYYAYELVFSQNIKMAVVWDDKNKRLITVENLVNIARLFGWSPPKKRKEEPEGEYQKRVHQEAASFIKNQLENRPATLKEPSEYSSRSQKIGTFTPKDVKQISNSIYTPLIPILAEPRTFMALVPANKAFDVVKAIKTKYEREMGKVRNRLPLHIGIVYAYRKMPLRAILDAGRRMLKQKWEKDVWEVVSNSKKLFEKGDKLPEEFNDDKDGQFKEWFEVLLKKGKRTLTWYVPAMMGDGKTEDHWYPYVFIASPTEPTNCNRYYKAENPWQSKHSWLVHAGELKKDDKIYFIPATFDFEFLDYNARRFEIAYDNDGKRKNSLAKPYLLDELEILEDIWKFIAKDTQNGKSRLSSAQIFTIRNLIESKREEWYENIEYSLKDENFEGFCRNLFINAEWQWGKLEKDEIEWLTDMAVRGYFADAIYLFHHVMKEKPEGE